MGAQDVTVNVTYTEKTAIYLTIIYVGAGENTPSQYQKEVTQGEEYNVTSPSVTGYTPDTAVVSGTVGSSDVNVTVTYTINSYKLTITYTGANIATHTETLNYGASYSVTTPTVTGYTPDKAVVSGTVGTSDINVTVNYTINSYKLTITYTGASVSTHTETLNYGASYSVTSPTVTGYKPDKAVVEGTIGTSDVSVTVTYSVQTYVLTINHVCGDKVLKTETQNVVFGQTATVNAQTITGYTASANSKTFTMDAEGKTVSYDYTVNSHTLTVIHNIYGGGTYSATETSTVNYGATYTASPKSVNGYIVVDKGAQSGTMPDNDVTVTFTYSLNTSATGVGENTVIPAISVITANTGFSITYTHTGANNDWCHLFDIGNVKVYAGCIELVDGSGAVTASMYDGQHGGGFNSDFGMSYNWDAVLPYAETHVYTISFDTNGSISWYKDGVRVLLFNTSSTNASYKPSNFVSSAISGVQSGGITVQTGVKDSNDSTITNVKVGYAQTVKAVTVTYSFNDGTVKQPSVYNMIDGYTYTVNNKMYGYTASADTSAISTSANATVSYTRASANSETLIDGDKTYTKELGTEMLAGVKRISGDFYIEIGLKDVVQMQASPNTDGVEQWWQTVLVEIQQSDAQENRFFRVDRYSWNPYGTWGHWTQGNVWWNNDANLYYQVMKNSSNITIKITRSGATVNVVYEIVSSATGGTYYMNFICENMAQTVDVGIGAEWSTFTLDYLKMECDRQATAYGKNYGGWTDTTGNYLIGTFSKTVASSQTVFIHQTGCIGIDSTAAWGDACWRTALIVLEGNGTQGLAGRADWCGWGVDGVYSAPVVTHDYNDQYHTGGAYELFVSANIAITVSSDGAGKLNVTVAIVPDRGPSIGKLITVNYSYDLYVDSINAYIGSEWATFKLSHQVFL
ncbi:MAG: MucBP domain-containing protein [Clostridia bacterium]|nr:MucBP domain-containing protein [Clostridia bacterium]